MPWMRTTRKSCQPLQNLDVNDLTPIDALNVIAELKKKAQREG